MVNRTGHSGFDYNLPRDQAAVGALLGDVTHATIDGDRRAMLTALMVQKATEDPGESFYRFARTLGVLGPGTEKFEFLQAQVSRNHDQDGD